MASGGDDTQRKPAKSDKERQRFLLSHHRMHRSSVRPFFCCGSQVSLNSITELKELPVVREKVIDDEYEDLTDSDDLIEDFDSLQINTTLKIEKPSQRPTRISSSKRKKTAGILQEKSNARNGKKFWTLKLRGKLQVSKRSNYSSDSELTSPTKDQDLCVCTSYKASTNEIDITGAGVEGGQPQASVSGATVSFPLSVIAHLVPPIPSSLGACGFTPQEAGSANGKGRSNSKKAVSTSRLDAPLPFVNLNELYPINDIDEQLIAQRRQEMEQGIEVEDVWVHKSKSEQSNDESYEETSATVMCSNGSDRPLGQYPSYGAMGLLASQAELQTKVFRSSIDGSEISGSQLSLNISPLLRPPLGVHTQVDYKHYLVPDMEQIVNSSFYWGVMDRYQAEKLIENKAEGTFLLRDSAQDEFLFSVSFRRYGRSLHARIEQWNHKFSFDSRDPGVFATDSVCGLIEHYKDPSCCMFFEPMLTLPLHRTFPFSLQHLTRATICSRITYDSINQLTLPTTLKEYLRFYHYKQKVRVRRFDNVVA